MTRRLSGKVLAFIRSQRVARVATVDRKGTPHNVPICPVAVSGRIYFASGNNARKVRNLRQNPHAALAFDHYTEHWSVITHALPASAGSCVSVAAGAPSQVPPRLPSTLRQSFISTHA
jgi:general stress protein 26